MELLRGETSKLHWSFINYSLLFGKGFAKDTISLTFCQIYWDFSTCFTTHPMISQSISFIVIRNDCSSFSKSTDKLTFHPATDCAAVKSFTLYLFWLSVQQLKSIIYSEHFRGGTKFSFIIMLKMLKLYKFYYSLDYLKNLHSHNILFQFSNGSHFL